MVNATAQVQKEPAASSRRNPVRNRTSRKVLHPGTLLVGTKQRFLMASCHRLRVGRSKFISAQETAHPADAYSQCELDTGERLAGDRSLDPCLVPHLGHQTTCTVEMLVCLETHLTHLLLSNTAVVFVFFAIAEKEHIRSHSSVGAS